MVFFERNQNERAEAAFGAALTEASLLDAGGRHGRAALPGGVSPGPERLQAAAAVPGRADLRAGGGRLPRRGQPGSARQVALPGRALPARAPGSARPPCEKYALIEKEPPSTATPTTPGCARRRSTPTTARSTRRPPCWARYPTAIRAGDMMGEALWRLALAAIQRVALGRGAPLAGREPAAGTARGDLVRRGAGALLEGAGLHQAGGEASRPWSICSGRSANTRCRSTRCWLSSACGPNSRRARGESAARAAQPAAWRPPASVQFGARPVFGTREFRRAVELARHGPRRRRAARAGPARASPRRPAATRPEQRRRPVGEPSRRTSIWITALLLDRGRSWAAAHAIPRYSLTGYRTAYPGGRQATVWRLAYPRAFPELVGPACKANRVPEALQLAIMREESAFNPRVESVANALGLTQMLVKTAVRFSDRPGQPRDAAGPGPERRDRARSFSAFLLERYGGMAPLDHRQLQRRRRRGRSLAARARRPRARRVPRDHPVRRDPQLHQTGAVVVSHLFLALRFQAPGARAALLLETASPRARRPPRRSRSEVAAALSGKRRFRRALSALRRRPLPLPRSSFPILVGPDQRD